jgi:predicted transcriptional regulator
LSFDELMTELKVDDKQEVLSQLNVIGDLVIKTEETQYSLTEQGVSKKAGGQYMLTEKGQDGYMK